jgi:hypothetical protein
MVEKWRQIPGFNGRYEASSLGRIRSTGAPHPQRAKSGRIAMIHRRARVLSLGSKALGYKCVELAGKSYAVSRLVCLAFHGTCPEGYQCAHLNGDPSDNRPTNLKWTTISENQLHKRLHGTSSRSLNAEQAAAIFRRRKEGEPASVLAAEFGVHPETIYKIGNGHYWKHVTQALF